MIRLELQDPGGEKEKVRPWTALHIYVSHFLSSTNIIPLVIVPRFNKSTLCRLRIEMKIRCERHGLGLRSQLSWPRGQGLSRYQGLNGWFGHLGDYEILQTSLSAAQRVTYMPRISRCLAVFSTSSVTQGKAMCDTV